MSEILILRGPSGSGKTTFALDWTRGMPNRVRVNRDDLRAAMFGASYDAYNAYFGRDDLQDCEKAVTRAEVSLATDAVRTGKDVVVDATNLKASYVKPWVALAAKLGATVRVLEFDEPLDVLLVRNATRDTPRDESVVRDMYQRWQSAKRVPIDLSALDQSVRLETYAPDPSKPAAWILDVDGTVALMIDRSPYDTSRYHLDAPNEPVIRVARALYEAGDRIIVTSGRDSAFRQPTFLWLNKHNVPCDDLVMRPEGDTRNDAVVKRELFWQYIAPKWNVLGAIDDRNRVVDMWRELGLTCLQVADGDF